jgi:hypothetical protein
VSRQENPTKTGWSAGRPRSVVDGRPHGSLQDVKPIRDRASQVDRRKTIPGERQFCAERCRAINHPRPSSERATGAEIRDDGHVPGGLGQIPKLVVVALWKVQNVRRDSSVRDFVAHGHRYGAFASTVLREPHTFDNLSESRIVGKHPPPWIELQPDHPRRTLGDATLEPADSLV